MKIINKISILFCGAALALSTALCLTSCEDYLDKNPDTDISATEAFKNFRNFQGFIEEIYNCIPDKEKCYWCPSWNWGDDEVFNLEAQKGQMSHEVDLGNFRAWQTTNCWLYRPGSSPTSTDKMAHSLWPHSWYCIRKANIGLENLNNLVGTTEEKNLLAGQLYFFRAWWHFELICYFGGLPYIDHVLNAGDNMALERPSFQETAAKCAEDFRRAADLLPVDWDNTTAGGATSGKNQLRINKIMALGYLGKSLLWAGSPLMKNGAQLGASKNGKTYDYDTEYCRKAADAFGELLNLVERGETQYALAEYNYKNIYDHERANGSNSNFSDIFYTTKQNWLMPGSVEAIFRGPSSDYNGSNWNTSKVFGPKNAKVVAHDNVIHQPTGNMIDAYGMKNGLPIDDPDSGYDPEHPYKNRDPRFYHDIVFDGFHYVLHPDVLSAEQKPFEYCTLYTGGAMRDVAVSSSTGYFCQKLIPHQCNEGDKMYDWDGALHCYLPYMRLADIYLMYAESGAVVGGAKYQSSNCLLTAEEAINKIRERCGAGRVNPKFTSDKNLFINEIRRERAVELSFEGYRFCDLQRWLLLTEPGYTEKYSHEFDRLEDDNFFKTKDPADARVANFRNKTLLVRKFDTKHYWFPLPENDTYLFASFKQNPGW